MNKDANTANSTAHPAPNLMDGKSGKKTLPTTDAGDDVLEEPRSRQEVAALGAPTQAAKPLAHLKTMVTKTVNASFKLVKEAAKAVDIAPTANSISVIQEAMASLKTDKILSIDEAIAEGVEGNMVLNDPNFKYQYIDILMAHSVDRTIEQAKAAHQELYMMLNKTLELHKKHHETMKSNSSDGSVTPKGLAAQLADTPAHAPQRPPLLEVKPVDKSVTAPRIMDSPQNSPLSAEDNPRTSPLTMRLYEEEPSPVSSLKEDVSGFIEDSWLNRPISRDGKETNKFLLPITDQTKQAELDQEAAEKERAAAEKDLAETMAKLQILKDKKAQVLAEEAARKTAEQKWDTFHKIRKLTAATMAETNSTHAKTKETKRMLTQLEAELAAHQRTEKPRTQPIDSPIMNPNLTPLGSSVHYGRDHHEKEAEPRQQSHRNSFAPPPQFDPFAFPGYKERTASRSNQIDPLEKLMNMFSQAMNNQTQAFTEAIANSRDDAHRHNASNQRSAPMNISTHGWLPEFDGLHPEHFPDFKIHFESLMEASNLNPATRLAALRRQLKGDAANALVILADPECAYEATMQNLEQMYGRACDPELLEQQFDALPFNKINPTVMNVDLAKHRALGLKLLSTSPASHGQLMRTLNNKLPSAMKTTLSTEIFDKVHQNFFKYCDRVRSTIGGLQISAISADAPAPTEDIFVATAQATRTTQHQDELEELTAEGETINTMYRHQMWRPPPNWRDRRQQGQPRQPTTCHICNDPEHIATDCSLSLDQRIEKVTRDGKCTICLTKDTHPPGQCPRKYKCSICRIAHIHHSALCGTIGVLETIRKGGADLQQRTKYSQYFPTGFRQQQ